MRGSVVLAGAILGAVSLVGVPAQGSAAPDPYSGGITTSCRIDVPAVVEPGKRVVIKVSVEANSPNPPQGQVVITISTKPGGDQVWRKSVPYNGGVKRVNGPKLAGAGDYTASSRFVSRDGTFAKCDSGAEAFMVESAGEERGPDEDRDNNNGPGGLLPDTGGPGLLWLLLGLGLVGGGTATVIYSRRRDVPAPA